MAETRARLFLGTLRARHASIDELTTLEILLADADEARRKESAATAAANKIRDKLTRKMADPPTRNDT